MVSHQEMQIRQLIWSEFRSGKTKQKAITKLDSVSTSTIDKWYQRFQSDEESIFDDAIVPAVQKNF
jgi:transposase